MRIIEIDLDIDFLFGISREDLLRLSEIVNNSTMKKTKAIAQEELDFNALRIYYNEVFSKRVIIFTEKAQINFNKRMKEGYCKSDIKKVIDNASNDKFHEANNFKNVTLEFLSRPDIFSRYVSELIHQVPRNKKDHFNSTEEVYRNH